MSINYLINQLLNYELKNKLIEEHDVVYCANKLIDILKVQHRCQLVVNEVPDMLNVFVHFL